MEPSELVMWFLALAIPAAIGFAWRITASLSRISDVQRQSLDSLRSWQKEIEQASKERRRFEETREKLQRETKAGVDRLIEMHMDPDRWGFGTGAVSDLVAQSNEALSNVANAVNRQADCQEDSQSVLRWLIENSDLGKAGGLPPPMRSPKTVTP